MEKFLSILVPHYNEPVEVIKPLLDSIAIQQNIDLSEIEVIICDDGPDAVLLPYEFLNEYPYEIKYFREDKGGVSKQRNKAFKYSRGEYVCWCDADDQFYHCLAFWFIKKESKSPMQVMVNNTPQTLIGFDALYSVFLEEGRHPETGEVYFIDRQDGFQFVHGKVFKSSFLKKNGIQFFDDCTIHEDNVLNGQVSACTQNIKWCPAPFYLWKWRDGSICRRDPLYIKKTYTDLIKSVDHLIDWFISKSKFDNARQSVAQIVYDAYYNVICHPSWSQIETEEYRNKTEKRFAEFFIKFEEYWNECPDQVKMQISNGIRQRVVQEGMLQEKVTLDDFLDRMKKL